MIITICGEAKDANEWAAQSPNNPPASVIIERFLKGYTDTALLVSVKRWNAAPKLRDAVPRDEYEAKLLSYLATSIPRHRFDVLVQLSKEIGLRAFRCSALRKNISKGNMAYALGDLGIRRFWGPSGANTLPLPEQRNFGWMKKRADMCRRWSDPFTRELPTIG